MHNFHTCLITRCVELLIILLEPISNHYINSSNLIDMVLVNSHHITLFSQLSCWFLYFVFQIQFELSKYPPTIKSASTWISQILNLLKKQLKKKRKLCFIRYWCSFTNYSLPFIILHTFFREKVIKDSYFIWRKNPF